MEHTLNLANLLAAAKAIENEPVDITTDLNSFSARASAAWSAVYAEERKAEALYIRFCSEFNDDERSDGLTNARDTAIEYGLYAKYSDLVEGSVEFWQCAIGSAEVSRDCK